MIVVGVNWLGTASPDTRPSKRGSWKPQPQPPPCAPSPDLGWIPNAAGRAIVHPKPLFTTNPVPTHHDPCPDDSSTPSSPEEIAIDRRHGDRTLTSAIPHPEPPLRFSIHLADRRHVPARCVAGDSRVSPSGFQTLALVDKYRMACQRDCYICASCAGGKRHSQCQNRIHAERDSRPSQDIEEGSTQYRECV